ncbi:MAG: transglutaminase family protein [Terrimicrobiaceae bacterium]|nr:transglutaminase family protein [Terrimicrobiaceae bacterium]
MNIGIRYHTRYAYDEAASFSPHLVRMFPRNGHYVRVARTVFETGGDADVQYRHDLFDNEVARCFYPEKCSALDFRLNLDLELIVRNPFHFLLDSHALRLPFEYLPNEAAVLDPFLGGDVDFKLPSALARPNAPRPTVEALVNLNKWIFENLAYERREEGEAMAPAATLAAERGACRDFAVLLAAVLREHGLAARLASGFLWEPPDTPKEDLRAESALHAWVETYLPGAGWVGLDPTNGAFCDHHRITAAVGLTPDDISPIKGCYYGHKKIESHMTASLEIKPR